MDKLPDFIVMLSEMLVEIKLVSFDASYESFYLAQPLRGADAAVRDYLTKFVLKQSYLRELIALV